MLNAAAVDRIRFWNDFKASKPASLPGQRIVGTWGRSWYSGRLVGPKLLTALRVVSFEKVAHVPFGCIQEIARHSHVLQVFIRGSPNCATLEEQDLSAGERRKDRRVRGNDELRTFAYRIVNQSEECENPRRRKRGLRFVKEVQTPRGKPLTKNPEKRLAVRERVRVFAVASHERRALTTYVHSGSATGLQSRAFVGENDIDLGIERSHITLDPLGESKSVLSAKEHPNLGTPPLRNRRSRGSEGRHLFKSR
jgi:hypothetical protein